jgi:hypothetical protein
MTRPRPSDASERDGPEVRALLNSLTDDHRMLLTLRRELYDGRWDAMLQDLRDRLEGRPHVFQWTPPDQRMRETLLCHLELIEQMQRAEDRLGIDLCDFVPDADQAS